jgi:hypothetical protein
MTPCANQTKLARPLLATLACQRAAAFPILVPFLPVAETIRRSCTSCTIIGIYYTSVRIPFDGQSAT